MNIVLTGYMGSGKTAVGKCIAELCGLHFVDTDMLIEEKVGITIPEIFKASGEEYFRRIESDIIKKVSEADSVVISTGGGAVLKTENIAELRKNGVIVNLEPEESVIAERLSGNDGTRPLIKGNSIEEIIERFRSRKPYYDNCDIKIKVIKSKGIEETAREVLKILEEKYEGEVWSGRE